MTAKKVGNKKERGKIWPHPTNPQNSFLVIPEKEGKPDEKNNQTQNQRKEKISTPLIFVKNHFKKKKKTKRNKIPKKSIVKIQPNCIH